MPKTNFFYYMLLVGAFVSNISLAMVFDNRFFPLFQKPRLSLDYTRSSFDADYMISTASKACDDKQSDIGLPEIFGTFDQAQLAKAFVAIGKPNPLRSEWQETNTIPWKLEGKRQMQGFAFEYHQSILDWLSTGFSWLFMRVNSRQEFFLQREPNFILGPGDELELNQTRRDMLTDLCLIGGNTAQLGFGDIDWYIRFGNIWEYVLKFRKIDAGVSGGLLIPTGVTREENRPASVPFGGNGHWGIYIAVDGVFEVREDIKAGVYARLNKRFARTTNRRMPANCEPQIFGAVCGPVRVNPGVTVVFSPYFILENMREGLGVGLNYTLTSHQRDTWTDLRSDKTVPVNLSTVEKLSKWGSDYFTLNVFYDFGKVKVARQFDPIISFRWDIPAMLFICNRVDKTHRISLGIEFAY